ncbi:MAG: CDP-alcohol phosphatidyltransferase family protein [Candidatus Omnitrophota bacterium]
MVEPLEQLNKICQKPEYKTKGNWYVRTILRDAALPATWLLLHTSITANQITLLSLAVALAGMFVLALPGSAAFLIGVLLLQFWYYLDHVDGQIARYRKTDCLTGRFLDFLTHHIVHTTLLFVLGFYVFQVTGSTLFVLWGFVNALAILVFNVVHDVKYKTFFEAITKQRSITLKTVEDGRPSNAFCARGRIRPTHCGGEGSVPLRRRLFSLVHKLCEIHVMMNILTLGAVVQIFLRAIDVRTILFLIYGLLVPAISITKVAYILKTHKIDTEYNSLIEKS